MNGQQIRKCRENQGKSQTEFAEWLGVSANTVSNWEHDRSKPAGEHYEALKALVDGAGGDKPENAALLSDTYSKPLPQVGAAVTGRVPAGPENDAGMVVKPPVKPNQGMSVAEDPVIMRGSFGALLEALDGIRRAVNQLAAKIDGSEALEARIRLLERDVDRLRGQLDQRKGAA